jgi:hypothetical protein
MKFLIKSSNSPILLAGMNYREKATTNNKRLRLQLLREQKNFCAYTEKYITEIDTTAVDHCDSSKKYSDDYYNYYTVIAWANNAKKDEQYAGASFFDNLFFQNPVLLNQRIFFSKEENKYVPRDKEDKEVKDFIDFLGFNHHDLFEYRRKHIGRLKTAFAGLSKEEIIEELREDLQEDPEQLNFITAIEAEFDIDLSSLL